VNALKHAQPSRVAVEIHGNDSLLSNGSGQPSVRIVVSNDGRGFPFRGRYDHAQLVASNAGPASLRDRVEALAGTLAIESMPTGSRVEITVPM
jgi:signal transduction histidine kinase